MRRSLLLMVCLLLVGCGGAPPVSFSALPAYPAAVELQPGQNPLADSLAESMRSALDASLSAEIRVYELPADTSFAQVEDYFTAQISADGWAISEPLNTSTDAFSTLGWQRGRNTTEQVLMLGYVPPILDAAPLLIVSLFGAQE
jgi:hypothetical protein